MRRSAAHGTLPVPPEEKFEILVYLAQDADPELRDVARRSLLASPPAKLAAFLSSSMATPELLAYFAERSSAPEVARLLIANPATPLDARLVLVGRLPNDLLADFLDKLQPELARPELIEALEKNPNHSEATRERLEEWKLTVLATDAETQAKAQGKPIESGEGEEGERERISVQQKVSRLSAAEKVQLGLKGNKEERSVLVRDGNKVVARAVLQSPKLSDGEVEGFAAMKNVSEDVLRTIASIRKFNKNYNIMRALVNNPRTPLDLSLHLMQRLNPADLKGLVGNRNVPETLRSNALKLFKQKTAPPGGGGGGGH